MVDSDSKPKIRKTGTPSESRTRGLSLSKRLADQLTGQQSSNIPRAEICEPERSEANKRRNAIGSVSLVALGIILTFLVVSLIEKSPETSQSGASAIEHAPSFGMNQSGGHSASTTLLTSFEYIVERDAFTENSVGYARASNPKGQSFYIGKPNKDTESLQGNTAFIMHTGQHICALPNDWFLVDYISLSGGAVTYQSQFRWDIAPNQAALTILPGEIADSLLAEIVKAEELRFRYRDACGNQATLIFATDGLGDALSKLSKSK